MSSQFWVGPLGEPDRIRLGPAVASGAEGILYRGYIDVAQGTAAVAVKMLHPGHLHRLAEWSDRWRRQVELMARMEVAGMVAVRGGFLGPLPHSAGNADRTTASVYLVMDWVDGVPLDQWLRTVPNAQPEQLLMALLPVAAALDVLHSGVAAGGTPLVHGDVKPANILIRPGGDTVLVDIGSVRGILDPEGSGAVGTPGYMAPEIADHGEYGPASDRYALGAVAVFLLTGNEPPLGATQDALADLLTSSALLAGRPEVALHVLAMLDPDPTRRPTVLANWLAQVRRSSLVALPGDLPLAPRAPTRNPKDPSPEASVEPSVPRRHRRFIFALTAVAAAIVLVITVAGGRGSRPTAASDRRASLGLGQSVLPVAGLEQTTTAPATVALQPGGQPGTSVAGPGETESPTTSVPPPATTEPPATTRPSTSVPVVVVDPRKDAPGNAPTGVTAAALRPTALRVTWRDNSTREQGFEVSTGGSSARVGANVTSHTLEGVASGKETCVRVRAFNDAGPGPWSTTACTSTPTA